MLRELRKIAQASRNLHGRVLVKESGLVGAALKGTAKGVGRAALWGLTNPAKAFTMGAGGIAAAGKARSTFNNMRPEVIRSQLGM